MNTYIVCILPNKVKEHKLIQYCKIIDSYLYNTVKTRKMEISQVKRFFFKDFE